MDLVSRAFARACVIPHVDAGGVRGRVRGIEIEVTVRGDVTRCEALVPPESDATLVIEPRGAGVNAAAEIAVDDASFTARYSAHGASSHVLLDRAARLRFAHLFPCRMHAERGKLVVEKRGALTTADDAFELLELVTIAATTLPNALTAVHARDDAPPDPAPAFALDEPERDNPYASNGVFAPATPTIKPPIIDDYEVLSPFGITPVSPNALFVNDDTINVPKKRLSPGCIWGIAIALVLALIWCARMCSR
jgi:hypothetical protein